MNNSIAKFAASAGLVIAAGASHFMSNLWLWRLIIAILVVFLPPHASRTSRSYCLLLEAFVPLLVIKSSSSL